MKVAVVGASGYVGLELLRILLRHPQVELAAVTSEQRAGEPVSVAFPGLAGLLELELEPNDPKAIAGRCELAFTALPHAVSAPTVAALHGAGVAVIDVSGDFRLHDLALYERYYGDHGARDLFGKAVYGLPELHREAIAGASLVAAPGCYPTGTLLPLVPFLRAGRIEPAPIHVDAKSGVSGAGRKLESGLLFAEVDASFRAYNVGGSHRHVPEIEQEASRAAGEEVRVAFTPHLLPTTRGLATSVYARPRGALRSADARAILGEAWEAEPFVRLLPEGETPSLAAVRGTNFCDVQALMDERTGSLVLLSAIDNLGKGASGQAVQCMNRMRGWPETTALLEAPLLP
jgi:N-acetyl-gamma-glutamyl-phosphate reductase